MRTLIVCGGILSTVLLLTSCAQRAPILTVPPVEPSTPLVLPTGGTLKAPQPGLGPAVHAPKHALPRAPADPVDLRPQGVDLW